MNEARGSIVVRPAAVSAPYARRRSAFTYERALPRAAIAPRHAAAFAHMPRRYGCARISRAALRAMTLRRWQRLRALCYARRCVA